MNLQLIIFYFFALLSVLSAFMVIIQKNIMHSVLYLAFAVLSVSGVFFTLSAEFLGAIQILVYAGGIVVLYLFVIIIVNMNEVMKEKRGFFPKLFIAGISLLFLCELSYLVYNYVSVKADSAGAGSGMDIKTLSSALLSKYIIPFEISSILLLGVLVGAIIIARRKMLHDSN